MKTEERKERGKEGMKRGTKRLGVTNNQLSQLDQLATSLDAGGQGSNGPAAPYRQAMRKRTLITNNTKLVLIR